MKRKNIFRLGGLVLALAVATLVCSRPGGAENNSPQITIYNQSFAVVKEIRNLNLKAGENEFRAENITAFLDPSSVILRDLKDPDSLKILEQNYEANTLSQGLLLSKFEGKEIMLELYDPETKKPIQKKVKIIRSGYAPNNVYGNTGSPIIEMDGKIRFNLPGTPLFDSLSSDAFLKPTLLWKLWSKNDQKHNVEFSYITSGMNWDASYNAVFPEKGSEMDLTGWVTITNQTGKDFEDASIKLLAGDVHRVSDQGPRYGYAAKEMKAEAAAPPPPSVTERTFEEYHIYDLNRSTTVRDRETKQVEFIRALSVPAEKIYVYDPDNAYRYDYSDTAQTKVWTMLEFRNSKKNNMGMPLPKGKVKVYRRDIDGRNELIGEDKIDHTPKDEDVRLYIGNAFDLVGSKKQTNFQENYDQHWVDESFEVSLRNHKKEPVEIRVIDHTYRYANWEIKAKSDSFEKLDSATIQFKLKVKPDEERKLKYTVHYWW